MPHGAKLMDVEYGKSGWRMSDEWQTPMEKAPACAKKQHLREFECSKGLRWTLNLGGMADQGQPP